MKKRFLSLTLLFLFVLGMAMPVSAHEEIGKEIDLQGFCQGSTRLSPLGSSDYSAVQRTSFLSAFKKRSYHFAR